MRGPSRAGGGAYELVSVGSGLALDVYGASNANGTPIDQYPYNGNPLALMDLSGSIRPVAAPA